jgi:hypothetical protein
MTGIAGSTDVSRSDRDGVEPSVPRDRRGRDEFHSAEKIRRDVSPLTRLIASLNYVAAQRDEHATYQRLRILMPKIIKIGLILATAALLIAAKQFAPVHAPSGVAPAAALSISPGEMMRSAQPLTETPVDNFI